MRRPSGISVAIGWLFTAEARRNAKPRNEFPLSWHEVYPTVSLMSSMLIQRFAKVKISIDLFEIIFRKRIVEQKNDAE